MAAPKPSISKENQQLIHQMVDDGYTIEQIAKELDVPTGTIANYVTKFNKTREEREQVEQTVFRRERTPSRLLEMIRAVPQVGETKIQWAEMAVKSNPLILNSPVELYSLLTQGLNMQPYPADLLVKGFFADAFSQNPNMMQGYMQFGVPQGGHGVPAYPYSVPNQPTVQVVQTPNGPVYMPAPASQQTLSRADVERIIAQHEDAQYVEETRPVINPQTGQPILGPDGQPILQRTRRPVNQSPDPMQQMMMMFQMMKLMRDADGGGSLAQQIAQGFQSVQGQHSGVDPQIQAMMMEMKVNNAKLEAQMDMMRSVTERDQHWMKQLYAKEQNETEMRQKLAIAQAGLGASDQIGLKAVDAATVALAKTMENNDKRWDRLERTLGPVMRGFAQQNQALGVPVPPSNQELASIAGVPTPPTEVRDPLFTQVVPSDSEHQQT